MLEAHEYELESYRRGREVGILDYKHNLPYSNSVGSQSFRHGYCDGYQKAANNADEDESS